MVAKMKRLGFDVEYYAVEGKDHCEMTDDAITVLDRFVKNNL